MFIKIKSFFQNAFHQANSLTTLSVLVKIVTATISSKIVSVYIGPAGIAVVGNFRNFFTSIETLATLGLQNGIVKYVAENKNNFSALSKHLSTIVISIFLATLFVCCILFGLASFWSDYVFETAGSFAIVFKIAAILLPCYVASALLLLILNGLEQYKTVIYFTIFGNILGLAATYFLIINFGLIGAILTIIVTQSLQFFVLIFILNKEIPLKIYFKWQNFDAKILKNLSSFSLMTFVSAVFVPMVYLSIRKYIIATIDIENAGYWATMELISTLYLLFISTSLSVFYFPKLASATSSIQTKTLFWQYYKTTMPFFAAGLLFLFFVKTIVLKTLFTSAFLPVENLFFYQLLGDFFKALSLILAYHLIARKHTFWFLFFELFSVSVMYFSSLYFVEIFKIEGVVMAHCFTYVLYFLCLAFYNRKNL